MWSESDFSRVLSNDGVDPDISEPARWAYTKAGRTEFSQRGFCLKNQLEEFAITRVGLYGDAGMTGSRWRMIV